MRKWNQAAKAKEEKGKETSPSEADDEQEQAATAPPEAVAGTVAPAEKAGQGSKIKSIKISESRLRNAANGSPRRVAIPKNLLPALHTKTHFKAAVEYSLGPDLTHRSLHDENGKVEKAIFEEYQRTITDPHHRKVGSAMTSALHHTIGGGETPSAFVDRRYTAAPEAQKARGASVTLSKRLGISSH